jgi:hypothetical protein
MRLKSQRNSQLEMTFAEERLMPNLAAVSVIDKEIADVRENIRTLTEQAAAYSGAEDDTLTAERIAKQEELLKKLLKDRETALAE